MIKCTLVVDATGVGAAVVDLIKAKKPQAMIRPVLITGGHAGGLGANGAWHVPKVDLVSTLGVLMESHRLKIAPSLPLAELLVKEMQNFHVKITPAANEIFEAWREGQHDDLVLASALACWWGEIHGVVSHIGVIPIDPAPRGFGRDDRPEEGVRRGFGRGMRR